MVETVKCSCGNIFPINRNKHKDRNSRICNNCKAKVEISKSFLNWRPNLDWAKKKLQDLENRRMNRVQKSREREIYSQEVSKKMQEEYWEQQEKKYNDHQ